MISWFGDFWFHGYDIICWRVWFHSHEIIIWFQGIITSYMISWVWISVLISWFFINEIISESWSWFHVIMSWFDFNALHSVWCHSFDVIIWCHRLCIGCHAMKSTMKSCIWNAFLRARAGPILLRISGGSSSLQRREFSPNSPLLPFIPRRCPVLVGWVVAIAQACNREAARFGSGAHCSVQVVPLLELVLKEVLVRFAVHGVERGQARFHARFRKSLDAAMMWSSQLTR